ncbi:MAG: CoA pyrophosphatase [Myxococcota bacterium]
MGDSAVNRDAILDVLSGYDPFVFEPRDVTRAAVLVPLREMGEGDALELILTRRSEEIGELAGQVAFPGGRLAECDATPTDGALREAHEELGIPPDRVEVIGRLDDMVTVTGYHVVAVVGLVHPDVELVPSPREVARVFTVPLDTLLDPDGWENRIHEWKGSRLSVWHFPYDGEDVWGATGRTVRNMVELLWKQQ